jgi:hypothetical protein
MWYCHTNCSEPSIQPNIEPLIIFEHTTFQWFAQQKNALLLFSVNIVVGELIISINIWHNLVVSMLPNQIQAIWVMQLGQHLK